MKMKNIAAVAMAGCMAASLAACGGSASSAASSAASTEAATSEAAEATGTSANGFTVQLGPNPETLDRCCSSTRTTRLFPARQSCPRSPRTA